MGFEDQAVPIFHLSPRQLEVLRHPSARVTIPPVGEQDAADIREAGRDRERSFYLASVTAVCRLWPFVARARRMVLDRGARWKMFGSSETGSSPATNRSCGASREVSTARCQRVPGNAGGKLKLTASAPALNIRQSACCSSSWIKQPNCFSSLSDQLGNPPCWLNQ